MKAYLGARIGKDLKAWLQKQADKLKWSLSKYTEEALKDHRDEINSLTKKKQS